MNTVSYGLGLGPGTGGSTTVVVLDAGSAAIATPVLAATVVTPVLAATVITPLIT